MALATSVAWAASDKALNLNPNAAVGQNPGETVMEPTDVNCTLITFEGLGDNNPIGTIAGPINVTFGGSWLSLVDFDDGGNGNFANEPSASTTAYFLDLTDISINLDQPVQFIEFFYSAAAVSLPVVVTAFDADNNVVDMAEGNVIGTSYDGALCAGDPNGEFCSWNTVTLNAPTNTITRVTIEGTLEPNFFGIDNLQFCVDQQELVTCCLPDASCERLSADGCLAAGGVIVADPDCEGLDCQTVDNDNTSWGTLKGTYR
jgi:hypothetical protein